MSVSDYRSLITSQHASQPNFIAWLIANLNYYDDINLLLKTFDDEFDIDKAVGVQLDTCGVILGQSRTVKFQPSNNISPTLDDETYRLVLKARILLNQWDGTNENLKVLWNTIFSEIPIILNDKQDMTMDIYINGLNSTLEKELISNGYIIPKPAGVAISYTFPDNIIFGYDENNTLMQGYDTGRWFYRS